MSCGLLEDDDDAVLVTSPDFPELTTFGVDRDEAVARAAYEGSGRVPTPH